ncbi:hypothetical protein Ocin01_16078 [Orchesella cincta]|uniref:Uncharacterized protein n=1 Tax=Orchesella cincta TaxID=48709 RepID=A0A1D2MCA6_ORCCI|nr:hypothetical protein Ocin01_16078 [Orchesella cincta]
MDVLDYVPFTGFLKNDEETIAIMTKAATIVPKACDILGISLSDSESEEDTAETAEDRSPIQPPRGQQVQQNPKARAAVNRTPLDKTGASAIISSDSDKPGCSTAGTTATVTEGANGPKTTEQIRIKRKRCASTPSNIGQSSSTNGFADNTSPSVSSTREESGIIPPKRRRFPSISLPPTSAISQSNMSEREANIRRKMLEDLEVFNTQIKQLAVIEKTKNRLLEKMLIISSALKNQGRASPTATSATNSHDNQ